MILAIETSTPVCSVALQVPGQRVWEKRIEGRGVHSERLFMFTDELLSRASTRIKELDAILFSRGPGSYTGLRIGASAVKGFLFEHDVPLYTLPTLLSFAAGLQPGDEKKEIFSVIDARRSHLYVQKLEWTGRKLISDSPPEVAELSSIEENLNDNSIIIGTGWERLNLEEKDNIQTFGTEAISAKNLITAWRTEGLKNRFEQSDPKTFEPDYLDTGQVNNSNI